MPYLRPKPLVLSITNMSIMPSITTVVSTTTRFSGYGKLKLALLAKYSPAILNRNEYIPSMAIIKAPSFKTTM
jgi:hypothetical protein